MEETLFTKIINKTIPARIAFEDDRYIVIHDLHPAAPVHLLVITKRPIASLNDVKPDDAPLLGGMFLVAGEMMKKLGHHDYRTVFNCGKGRSNRFSISTCMCWPDAISPGRRDE